MQKLRLLPRIVFALETAVLVLACLRFAHSAEGPALASLRAAAVSEAGVTFDNARARGFGDAALFVPARKSPPSPGLDLGARLQRNCGGFSNCYHESLKSYGSQKMQQVLATAGAFGTFYLLGQLVGPALYPVALIGAPIGLGLGLALGTLLYGLFIARGKKQ